MIKLISLLNEITIETPYITPKGKEYINTTYIGAQKLREMGFEKKQNLTFTQIKDNMIESHKIYKDNYVYISYFYEGGFEADLEWFVENGYLKH